LNLFISSPEIKEEDKNPPQGFSSGIVTRVGGKSKTTPPFEIET